MYSHEDRKRAVELYIEYGLSAADVIRELGYPNRHSPRNWHEDYLEHGGVRESAHEPRFYSDEEKRRAVDHFLGHGRKPSLTIRAPGYPGKQALYEWVDKLEDQVSKLELKKAILEGTVELLGKDPGADPNRLTSREKTLLVQSLRPDWPLSALLGEVGLARSSYQYQAEALSKPDKHAELRVRITEIFHESGSGYGYRRIHLELRKEKVVVSEKVACAIMKEEGLANSMLEAACSTLGEGEHPRIHSDRGCHYRWPGWIKICDGNGLERSMSKRGAAPTTRRARGSSEGSRTRSFTGRAGADGR